MRRRSVASFLFWFWQAPDIRFAGALFWVSATGFLVLACQPYFQKEFFIRFTLALFIGFNALILFKAGFIKPGPDHGFYPIRTTDLNEHDLAPGLIVYTPQNGDQCWDSPLVCTPDYRLNDQLALRKEGSLRHGFIVNN